MKIQILFITFVFAVVSSFQVHAGGTLSADEIKTLIIGKTIHAKHLKKGFNFSAYFAKDGSMIRKWKNGKLQDGKYFFKGDLHCINMGGNDKCGAMEDNGDGTYKRLKNGNKDKHFITWTKIVEGKDL